MRFALRVLACSFAISVSLTWPIGGQIVPVRTVPVASGDQFLLLPSQSMAMGGLRVAVADSLADPWSNPAKGIFVQESAFLGSPTFYSISNNGGAGRSFPMAGVIAGSRWFGGVALALQQIENDSRDDVFLVEPTVGFWEPRRRLSDAFNRNLYGSGFLGMRLGAGWSVGLGLSAAQLDAMDGVDLLYVDANRIDQRGSTQDVRLGLHLDDDRDRLSLLLLHSRVSMTHDVTYEGWIWDPVTLTSVFESRVERNEDKSRTWGAQLEWDRDLTAPGWRIGASATVNRKSHPKIPNYDIQNIPRDPGTTWAYEAAFGFARTEGPTTVGVDLVLQPIWSETWQEADAQDVADSGGSLGIGDRSIENAFFFTNVLLRTGVSHAVGKATLQAGLEARSYDYTLEQVNHVTREYREQDESWMEWTPTFGVVFRLASLDLRYAVRRTSGTGRPGTEWSQQPFAVISQAEGDFIIAPQGPLTLQEASVLTQQLSVRIPVR
ncbi:MAG: hypothetical protein OEO79_11675 [Gemmatimonadota bacterium]|nr:hypothetical protein [Gemmatimonadota bacterium]